MEMFLKKKEAIKLHRSDTKDDHGKIMLKKEDILMNNV